ncbi:virulence factor Mce family protein [Amycolatopsis marina]|uniref:Virulence factor Mce family protein n=1 Tax=Amycolatopsis marina TaxID=490629 RepID=A0A1I1CR22_9PSEU|nr:MCE family protein [Amycolatopsis marina]SFB62883.1 virulence factor Mce family protein [Amycolatopsis marina]
MTAGDTRKRLGTQFAGVIFFLVLALMLWFAVAVYEKRFTTVDSVILRADRVGMQLDENAEVKVRGVPFGEVRDVRTTPAGAEIELAMDPAKIDQLPRNVSARLLPKTVFGERYVSLVLPDQPDPHSLAAGDVIPQDRSENAIELERVLGNLLPLLEAVQPQKLSASLGAVAQALDTRGEALGESIVGLDRLLAETNPLMPQFKEAISGTADVAELYTDVAPEILQALADLTVTGRTIADERESLDALYAEVRTAARELGAFLRDNRNSLIGLTESSRPTLELLAKYSPSFPCLFDSVNRLTPLLEKAFGAGTGEPGLHVKLSVQQPRGKYVPGRDAPVYNAGGGPRCYPPGSAPGQGRRAAAGGPAPRAAASLPLALQSIPIENSPYERQLMAELMAPVLGVTPPEVAGWSGMLLGPLLRGTEVTLR